MVGKYVLKRFSVVMGSARNALREQYG